MLAHVDQWLVRTSLGALVLGLISTVIFIFLGPALGIGGDSDDDGPKPTSRPEYTQAVQGVACDLLAYAQRVLPETEAMLGQADTAQADGFVDEQELDDLVQGLRTFGLDGKDVVSDALERLDAVVPPADLKADHEEFRGSIAVIEKAYSDLTDSLRGDLTPTGLMPALISASGALLGLQNVLVSPANEELYRCQVELPA
jgi:hypothetical protein